LAAAETERTHRRLYLTGSHLTGVSVGDCIVGSARVAERVMAELA
jgi:protoporphyrinogen oxidase